MAFKRRQSFRCYYHRSVLISYLSGARKTYSIQRVIRLRHGPSGVGIQTGAKHFSFLQNVQIGSGPQVSYSADTRVKRSGREVDHSSLSSAEVVTNEWSYTSASPVCLHGVYTDLHFFPLYTSAPPSANYAFPVRCPARSFLWCPPHTHSPHRRLLPQPHRSARLALLGFFYHNKNNGGG